MKRVAQLDACDFARSVEATFSVKPQRVSFNDSLLLQLGDYELIAEADVIGFVQDGGFFSRDASYDLTFTLVPEPASGILLLIGASVLARRRRSKQP